MRRKQHFAAVLVLGLISGAISGVSAHAQGTFNIDMTGYDNKPWTTIAMANDDTVQSGVCVREAESEKSKALGFLYRGGAVNVLKKGETWSEVESGGLIGYIRNEYLTFGTEAKGLAEYYGYYGVEANWNDVKVFAADNANAKIIGTVNDGETFPIVNNNGHWLEIQTGVDKTAYVSSEDVTMVMVVDTAVSIEAEKNGNAGKPEETVSSSASEQTQPADSDGSAASGSEESYSEESGSGESSSGESSSGESGSGESSSGESSSGESGSGESSSGESGSGESGSGESSSGESSSGENVSEESGSEESSSGESGSEESSSGESGSDETSGENTDDGSTSEGDNSDETWEEDASADESYEEEDTGSYEGEDYIEDTTTDETYSDETYSDETYTDESNTDNAVSEDTYNESNSEDTYNESNSEDTYNESNSEENSYTEESATQTGSSDSDLLAALIWCEAGNQPYEGMVAVGAVVMNRVASSSFPNTISEVIYQSGQFTPAYSGALSSALANGVPSSCHSAAGDALAGSDPTGGALYFNTSHGSGVQIGAHWFY